MTTHRVLLGGLQAIALLLPVVILTGRWLLDELEPSREDSIKLEKRKEKAHDAVGFATITSLVALGIAGVFLAFELVLKQMPALAWIGVLALLIGFATYAMILIYIAYFLTYEA